MNKGLKKKIAAACAATALILPITTGVGGQTQEAKAFDFFDWDDDRYDRYDDNDWDDRYDIYDDNDWDDRYDKYDDSDLDDIYGFDFD